ncbi:MAG: RNA polymerase sigma factor [Hyphomicrobiales bacterium]
MTLDEFKIIVFPVNNILYRVALRLLGRREEAEDIVQEAFLRLWSKRKRLHEYRSIEGLAITITKNLCLDKLKSKGFQATVTLTGQNLHINEQTPHSSLEATDQMEIIHQLIDELPDQQKLIVHLRDIEGLGYEEIADITGVTVNALRVSLSRARRKVRDQLLKIYHYECQGS